MSYTTYAPLKRGTLPEMVTSTIQAITSFVVAFAAAKVGDRVELLGADAVVSFCALKSADYTMAYLKAGRRASFGCVDAYGHLVYVDLVSANPHFFERGEDLVRGYTAYVRTGAGSTRIGTFVVEEDSSVTVYPSVGEGRETALAAFEERFGRCLYVKA